MIKTITILVIITAFVVGSSTQFAEGTWWPGLKQIGFSGPDIIRITDEFVVPANQGGFFVTTCDPGDVFFSQSVFMNVEPPDFTGMSTGLNRDNVNDGNTPFVDNANGWFVDVFGTVNFDRKITVSIVCARPSTINEVIGGLLLESDYTALFLAYGIANAVWLTPTLAGIGIGVYLTKSKWKKK